MAATDILKKKVGYTAQHMTGRGWGNLVFTFFYEIFKLKSIKVVK